MITTKQTVYERTAAYISLSALESNVVTFCNRLSDSTKLMAIVKANAYGHGSIEVARTALANGASCLGVAMLEEGEKLRLAGITAPILLLGYTPSGLIERAIKQQLTLTVFDAEGLEMISRSASALGQTATVHLKYDTGMCRIGIRAIEELIAVASQAKSDPAIYLEGLFTHFATADWIEGTYTQEQFRLFMKAVCALESVGISIPIKHCCNTAATIKYPDMHLDMVRVGIGLYGDDPRMRHSSKEGSMEAVQLQPVMQLRTRIAALKWVAEDEYISYGRTYRAQGRRLIATLPAGYGDGVLRSLSNKGELLLRGHIVPIVGTICMDQLMVDVTSVPDVEEGETVVIFGVDAVSDHKHSAAMLAEQAGTISYELFCGITDRVPRWYDR